MFYRLGWLPYIQGCAYQEGSDPGELFKLEHTLSDLKRSRSLSSSSKDCDQSDKSIGPVGTLLGELLYEELLSFLKVSLQGVSQRLPQPTGLRLLRGWSAQEEPEEERAEEAKRRQDDIERRHRFAREL